MTSSSNVKYKIIKLLGAGGQGEVYQVSSNGNNFAMKWYHKHTATKEQKAILKKLVERGSPTDRFLWPTDLIAGKDTFGYIMKLRPPNYKSIIDMMKRKAEPTFYTLCLAGYNLADSYQKLHSLGYCYRDISFGNIFFDPNTGEVLICDNDNITPNGVSNAGVYGTPRFMAPEIITGKGKPSTDTDLFSMSVLLFYMFMLHHPLEGKHEMDIKCLDMAAMNKLYGFEPLFIWDMKDRSNRPVPGYQENAIIYWNLYPQFFRDIFTEAFMEGITHPKKRILEKQWKDALLKLRDSILYCPYCGSENFYDTDKLRAGIVQKCWACQKSLSLPPRLKIGSSIIMLNRNTKISEHHLLGNYNIQKVVAEITQNPDNPNVWGIRNLTEASWVYKKPDGTSLMIETNKNAPIAVDVKINFGSVEGEIKTN